MDGIRRVAQVAHQVGRLAHSVSLHGSIALIDSKLLQIYTATVLNARLIIACLVAACRDPLKVNVRTNMQVQPCMLSSECMHRYLHIYSF